MNNGDTPQSGIFLKSERLILGFLSALSLVLGIVGFKQHYVIAQQSFAYPDLLYLSVRLFLFDFPDILKPPLYLDIARWLAPLTLSYTLVRTVLSFAHSYMLGLQLRYIRGHAVVVGLNANTAETIQSFHEQDIKVIVIDRDAQNPNWSLIKKRGIYTLIRNPEDPKLMLEANIHKASYLIASTHSNTTNLELIHTAYAVKQNSEYEHHLDSVCCISDDALMDAMCSRPLFATNHAFMNTRIINYDRANARSLINQFGPDRFIPNLSAKNELRVTFLGNTLTTKYILLRLAEIGIYGESCKLTLQLVSADSDVECRRLINEYPAISELVTIKSEIRERIDRNSVIAISEASEPDIIYFCAEETDETLLGLQSIVDLGLQCPVIVAETHNQSTFDWLESEYQRHQNICFASLQNSFYHYESVFGDRQDELAIAIHNNYVEKQIAAGDSPKTNPSLANWGELPEILKNANRNQVDHIGIKFRYLTGKSMPTSDELTTAITPDNKVALAKMEHQRWLADKKLAGWRYTDGDKDNVKRLSPSLIEWDDLSDEEKQKDVDTVDQLPALLEILSTSSEKT